MLLPGWGGGLGPAGCRSTGGSGSATSTRMRWDAIGSSPWTGTPPARAPPPAAPSIRPRRRLARLAPPNGRPVLARIDRMADGAATAGPSTPTADGLGGRLAARHAKEDQRGAHLAAGSAAGRRVRRGGRGALGRLGHRQRACCCRRDARRTADLHDQRVGGATADRSDHRPRRETDEADHPPHRGRTAPTTRWRTRTRSRAGSSRPTSRAASSTRGSISRSAAARTS